MKTDTVCSAVSGRVDSELQWAAVRVLMRSQDAARRYELETLDPLYLLVLDFTAQCSSPGQNRVAAYSPCKSASHYG